MSTHQASPPPEHRLSPQGTYVVVRVPDVERSADFYRSLGLELTQEKHGEGPIHYSFQLSRSVVCELYPLKQGSDAPTPGVRLGFEVADVAALKRTLAAQGRELLPGTSSASFVVIDPSGNQVEISGRVPS